jgi:hypothetical protein
MNQDDKIIEQIHDLFFEIFESGMHNLSYSTYEEG